MGNLLGMVMNFQFMPGMVKCKKRKGFSLLRFYFINLFVYVSALPYRVLFQKFTRSLQNINVLCSFVYKRVIDFSSR